MTLVERARHGSLPCILIVFSAAACTTYSAAQYQQAISRASWEAKQTAGMEAAQRGDESEAEAQFTSALQAAEGSGDEGSGERDGRLGITLSSLGALYQRQGRLEEAEPLLTRALPLMKSSLGPDHPAVATGLNNLALVYAGQGRPSEAEPLFKQSLESMEKTSGLEHPNVAATHSNLGELYLEQGRDEEADRV